MDYSYNDTDEYRTHRRVFEPSLTQTTIRSSLLPQSCIKFHFHLDLKRLSVVRNGDGTTELIGELLPVATYTSVKLPFDNSTTMSDVRESLLGALEHLPLSEVERRQVIMHACVAARESVGSIQNIRHFNINLEFKLLLEHDIVFDLPSSEEPYPMLKKYGVRGAAASEINGEDESCCICLDDLLRHGGEEVMSTPCHHLFHGRCLKIWLDKHSSCPLCRFQIKSSTTAN